MNIRNFKLKNNDGTIYDLTKLGLEPGNLESLFFDVSGLGFEKSSEFVRIGSDFIKTTDFYSQQKIQGQIFFSEPGAYKKYYVFNRFVENGPLKLIYTPSFEVGEFERTVEVTELTKTEITVNGLYCNISFLAQGLVEKIVILQTQEGGIVNNPKRYNYRYNYKYTAGKQNSVTLDVDSEIKSPVELTITGPAVNPEWKHYIDDKLVATGKVFVRLNRNDQVVINSNVPYKIYKTDVNNSFELDYYQQSDFSTKRFLYLKKGKNTISLGDETGAGLAKMTMKGFIKYGSV